MTRAQEIFMRLSPFVSAFRAAIRDDAALPWVCGVFDRESLGGTALRLRVPGTLVGWGDKRQGRYHGFGGCQKDTGGGGEMLIRGLVPGIDLWTPEGQASFVYRHVSSSLRIIEAALPALARLELLEAALCAYNADIGAVLLALEERKNPNSVTTDGNYGADVMLRAALVAPLLGATT